MLLSSSKFDDSGAAAYVEDHAARRESGQKAISKVARGSNANCTPAPLGAQLQKQTDSMVLPGSQTQ